MVVTDYGRRWKAVPRLTFILIALISNNIFMQVQKRLTNVVSGMIGFVISFD